MMTEENMQVIVMGYTVLGVLTSCLLLVLFSQIEDDLNDASVFRAMLLGFVWWIVLATMVVALIIDLCIFLFPRRKE